MKKLVLAAIASAIMVSSPVFAADKKPTAAATPEAAAPVAPAVTPVAPSLKIGVLDIQEVMKNASEIKTMQASLQKEFGPKLDEIKNLDKGLREGVEKLQRDRDIMSEAARTKLETELQSTQQELVGMQTKYQQDSTAKQQAMMQEFLNKVKAQTESYAKEQKYDMIMLSEAVPYIDDKFEITKEIIKRLG